MERLKNFLVPKMNHIDKLVFNFSFYYFKIFGSGPISFKSTNGSRNNNVQWIFNHSKDGILYNIIILTMLLSVRCILLYQSHSTGMNKWLNNVIFFSYFCIVLVLLKFFIERRKFDSIMDKLNFIHQYDKKLVKKAVMKNVFTTMILLTIDLLALSYYHTKYSSIFVTIGVFLSILWVHQILFSVFIQFSFFLDLIENCMKSINNEMINMLKCNNNILYNIQSSTNSRVIVKLHQCVNMYSFLCDLSQELSSYYSFPLLMCVTVIFTRLLTFSYVFLQALIIKNSFQQRFLISVSIVICLLFLITKRVTAIQNEVYIFFHSSKIVYLNYYLEFYLYKNNFILMQIYILLE